MRESKETERVGDCSTWYTLFNYRAVLWICTDIIKLKDNCLSGQHHGAVSKTESKRKNEVFVHYKLQYQCLSHRWSVKGKRKVL